MRRVVISFIVGNVSLVDIGGVGALIHENKLFQVSTRTVVIILGLLPSSVIIIVAVMSGC